MTNKNEQVAKSPFTTRQMFPLVQEHSPQLKQVCAALIKIADTINGLS
jgi:hypothetical protein